MSTKEDCDFRKGISDKARGPLVVETHFDNP